MYHPWSIIFISIIPVFVVEADRSLHICVQLQRNTGIADDVAGGGVEGAEDVPARGAHAPVGCRRIVGALPGSFYLKISAKVYRSRSSKIYLC